MAGEHLSDKTQSILKLLLACFLLILFRVWHLEVIQRDERLKEAQKPRERTLLVKAQRGAIVDRFGLPLAINRICYSASVYYSQIAEIPSIAWESDEAGKKRKVYPRREHIAKLSHLLGELLELEPSRVEDLIHSKASLFPHVPYLLKTGLDEKTYYRLKMLERRWPGLSAEIGSERYYPLGKVGCGVIGTMGTISGEQFSSIAEEIRDLEAVMALGEGGAAFFPAGISSLEEAATRLQELKEKAYAMNDWVGKTGIEALLEEKLRGVFGKEVWEVNQKGRPIRELQGGRKAIAGETVTLSLSAELQQFAETLLAEDEKRREGRSLGIDPLDGERKVQKQPWIKGGAIVALDPKTGEVLALASHPRFDPNDFAPSHASGAREEKQLRIHRWLEDLPFLEALWEGRERLEKERGEGGYLTWEFYLKELLPKESPIRTFLEKWSDVKSAIQVAEDFETLLYFKGEWRVEQIAEKLSSAECPLPIEAAAAWRRLHGQLAGIFHPLDRLFAVDLCRLAVYSPAFPDELIAKVGSMSLSSYRALEQAVSRLEKEVEGEAIENFHRTAFPLWRKEHEKSFLAEKRALEKKEKKYPRPYLDYLDKKERELFEAFWKRERLPLLKQTLLSGRGEAPLQQVVKSLTERELEGLLRTFRSCQSLSRPLLYPYKTVRRGLSEVTERDLALAFYPKGGYGFGRSYAFQTAAPLGSVFKLVIGYEGLRQGKMLHLIDEIGLDPQGKGEVVAYTPNRTPYPRIYKGGRLPRSHLPSLGAVDLIGALEQSSNPYFAILAGDLFEKPDDAASAAALFGFGEKSGVALPGEARGKLPDDLERNRTGLYSFAIGQHTLLSTPLQTAAMLAVFGNGGKLLCPEVLRKEGEVRRLIPLPPQIRTPLLEGMDRVIWGAKGSARPSVIKNLLTNPLWMRDYLSLEHQLIGKTGTAEILLPPDAAPSSPLQVYKYIWFGGLSFSTEKGEKRWENPELAVVVFLRYGDGGKEAAPLAAQVIKKWREIQKKHATPTL